MVEINDPRNMPCRRPAGTATVAHRGIVVAHEWFRQQTKLDEGVELDEVQASKEEKDENHPVGSMCKARLKHSARNTDAQFPSPAAVPYLLRVFSAT